MAQDVASSSILFIRKLSVAMCLKGTGDSHFLAACPISDLEVVSLPLSDGGLPLVYLSVVSGYPEFSSRLLKNH